MFARVAIGGKQEASLETRCRFPLCIPEIIALWAFLSDPFSTQRSCLPVVGWLGGLGVASVALRKSQEGCRVWVANRRGAPPRSGRCGWRSNASATSPQTTPPMPPRSLIPRTQRPTSIAHFPICFFLSTGKGRQVFLSPSLSCLFCCLCLRRIAKTTHTQMYKFLAYDFIFMRLSCDLRSASEKGRKNKPLQVQSLINIEQGER